MGCPAVPFPMNVVIEKPDVVFVELEYAFPVPEPLVVPLVVVPAFQLNATYFSVLVFTLTSAST